MSTPDNSTGPEYPLPSDNPRKSRSGGPASVTEWFRQPNAWIAGLCPPQADSYDSGEVTTGLTLAGAGNASDIKYSLRRRGKDIDAWVSFIYTGDTFTIGPSGNIVDLPLLYLPGFWRPWRTTYDAYLGKAALYRLGVKLEPTGLVSMVDGPPNVTVTNGDELRFNAKYWLA